MCNKTILLVITIFINAAFLSGQTIHYSYDANGNRTGRILTVEQLKSESIHFPVRNPKNIPFEDSKIKPIEGDLCAIIYPNPNRGLLNIDITNMPVSSATELRLYDLSAIELMVKRNFGNFYELDISHLKDGIYILRIKINDRLFDWKVIKSNR